MKTKKEQIKENLKTYMVNITLILFIILFFLVGNSLFVHLGQPIKNINYGITLSKHIENNGLSLPLPNIPDLYAPNQYYEEKFKLPLNEFELIIKDHYFYELDTYDCKYWAYVWTLYWKKNRLKYNWNLDYITTENHIFVMVSNESGYIILDGSEVTRMMIN